MKRIWPFDDESGVASDEVVVAEDEERGRAFARGLAGARGDALALGHIASFGYGRSLCAIAVVQSSQTPVTLGALTGALTGGAHFGT